MFDENAASSQTAHPRGRFDGKIANRHALFGCPHGVAHGHGGNYVLHYHGSAGRIFPAP